MNDEASTSPPITVRFAEPWLADNQLFIQELTEGRTRTLETIRDTLRPKLIAEGLIKVANPADPVPIGAVDAAVINAPFGDSVTVLVQAARCQANETYLDKPFRFGPFTTEEARFLRVPARMSREVMLLSEVTMLTIADNSLWSFLMDLNKAIGSRHNELSDMVEFTRLIDELTTENGSFLKMLENPNVIAMSKQGLTRTISKRDRFKDLFCYPLTDKEVCTFILDEGEYLSPQSLSEVGKFGVEVRSFSRRDRERIEDLYYKELMFTYYKPWRYQQAYRIEGKRKTLNDVLFSSIKAATIHRGISEPEPQFLVDYVVKQIDAIADLYGELNQFRTPFLGFSRTLR